jgi:hypothetical protein
MQQQKGWNLNNLVLKNIYKIHQQIIVFTIEPFFKALNIIFSPSLEHKIFVNTGKYLTDT